MNLLHAKLPFFFLRGALMTTNYLQNRCLTKVINENKNP